MFRVWFAAVFILCLNLTLADEHNVAKKTRSGFSVNLTQVIHLLTDLKTRVIQLEQNNPVIAGRDGRDGLNGKPGKDGRDGNDGKPGPQGSPGLKGEQGQQGLQGVAGPRSGGIQYVRWGRTVCPSDATLVYKGRIGGEWYSHSGGGSNQVCLPLNPIYGSYDDANQGGAFMYGTEYEVPGFNPFNNRNLQDHDAPCAVCYVETRSVTMMIPATNECSTGWTKEYHGYLMAERHNHAHSSGYICVDEDAETVPGTSPNLNGALLRTVEGRCGSLPCHPYVEGRELTCVVCSK